MSDELTLRPIGVLRTPYHDLAEVPRQPRLANVRARIELAPGMNLEEAAADLEGWDYVWVLTWMHRATGWRPKVQPPRSERKRGVLSTRAPHRPNPIGLSAMRLVSVSGLVLEVEECDAVDGTPVLDVKPYVPWADAIPNARTGWLTPPDGAMPGGDRPADPRPTWPVDLAPRAVEQLAFLRERGVDLEQRLVYALSLGPQPHAYRRITEDERGWRIAVKEWIARFETREGRIEVTAVESGLHRDAKSSIHAVHAEFVARWGPAAR